MKELCNAQACHQVKDVYLRFYQHLPESAALPLVDRKMRDFRTGLQKTHPCMDRNCGPMLEIQSRINS